jgi:hypothetical protein
MPIGRRLTALLLALGLVSLPAAALRAFCLGKSCDSAQAVADTTVPFCSLPASMRSEIAAGFREGRSPDVMAASRGEETVVTPLADGGSVAWPSVGADPIDARVPIVLFGRGIERGTAPDGTGLDQIAPTLAEAMGYRRSHPEVRAGRPIDGAVRPPTSAADAPGIVVVIAWKSVGTADLGPRPHAWPFLRSLLAGGTGTLRGSTGSLPLDPAATLTTIGTGGLPSQHGVTGSIVRGDGGTVATSWGPGSPGSVIATLADDFDHDMGQRADVGAVLQDRSDLGLVGDGWYVDGHDRDRIAVGGRPLAAATRFLDTVPRHPGTTALLDVVVRGSIRHMDRTTGSIVRAVSARVPAATFAVAATGGLAHDRTLSASAVTNDVQTAIGAPVVAAPGAGGVFLDRAVATERGLSTDDVARSMRSITGTGGDTMFADAFPSFAVSFARYC